MNIYKFELNTYKNSIIIWSLVVIGMLFLYMSFFPSFSKDAELLDEMMKNFPPEFLEAFGLGGEVSMATIPGFFSFLFTFIQLFMAIQASNYGFHFLSVEERELTADFLMTKPVTRKKIIISKFLAAFTALTIVNVITWIASFTVITIFRDGHEYNPGNIVILLSTIVLFQLVFLGIGMLVSVSVRKIRSVLSYSLGLSFGMYILSAVEGLTGVEIFKYISPFAHFSAEYILYNGKYNIGLTMISVLIIIVSLVTGYFLYLKRNIHSV